MSDLFTRATHTAPGRADNFLRQLDSDIFAAETGEVEAPTGWVAIVEITRDDIAEYVTREGDPWMSERRNFAPGWYLIRINSDGLIWGLAYDTEQDARDDFAQVDLEWAMWHTDTEE